MFSKRACTNSLRLLRSLFILTVEMSTNPDQACRFVTAEQMNSGLQPLSQSLYPSSSASDSLRAKNEDARTSKGLGDRLEKRRAELCLTREGEGGAMKTKTPLAKKTSRCPRHIGFIRIVT